MNKEYINKMFSEAPLYVEKSAFFGAEAQGHSKVVQTTNNLKMSQSALCSRKTKAWQWPAALEIR